ncbi:MAG: glycosyltransferase family 4 protein, partial [bacterium]
MKVCLLTPEFLPMWGGVGAYTYNLATQLRDEVEIHVLTAENGAGKDETLIPDGVQVHSIPTHGAAPETSPLTFQLGVRRRLPRLAEKHGFDIVHTNHAYMSDLLLRSKKGMPTVLTVHTTLDTQSTGTRAAGSGSPSQTMEANVLRWQPLLSQVERYYLRRRPSIIFVSRWVRDRTVNRYHVNPRYSAVVPNGVNTDMFSPNGSPRGVENGQDEGPTLLFAGRLLALKGIGTLLEAMTRLNDDINLFIAGPGDQAGWRSMVHRLGLEGRVRFLGSVHYGRMPTLYRQVDAVVLPSFGESCPMVALEAMASGTPLIAADAGGITEIVQDGETGWLVY